MSLKTTIFFMIIVSASLSRAAASSDENPIQQTKKLPPTVASFIKAQGYDPTRTTLILYSLDPKTRMRVGYRFSNEDFVPPIDPNDKYSFFAMIVKTIGTLGK